MHAAPLPQLDRWARNRPIAGPPRTGRRALFWVLAAILIALLACCTAPVALGQTAESGWVPTRMRVTTTGPATSSLGRSWTQAGFEPSLPQVEVPAAPPGDFVWSDPCRPDLWIVSSRRCADPECPHVPPCCLDYFHQLPDGRFYRGSRGEFQQWLQPGVPVCVVVHGSFSDWPTVRQFAVQAYRWLKGPGAFGPLQVVMFTWPSDGPTDYVLFPYDITVLGHRSGQYGLYLAQFLVEIPPGHPVTVLGHSHGVRVAASALHALGGGAVDGMRIVPGPDPGNRIRLVSAAAAFDHHWLNPGERYGRALCRAEAVLNLRNRHDCALSFYPLQKPGCSRRALARAGFTPEDLAAMGPLRFKAYQIDITWLIGPHHFWTSYYATPEIARMISPFVHYADAASPLAMESTASVQ